MAGNLDLARLKTQVEAAMETLLRAADARVSWKQPPQATQELYHSTEAESVGGNGDSATDTQTQPAYSFIPGVYCSLSTHGSSTGSGHSSDAVTGASHAHSSSEFNDGELRVMLHGDNTFEYAWSMKRSAPRAMEFSVEMTGEWRKPVLNRSRRGEDDQRVFLSAKKMRFQRLSNYDAETGAWKLWLKTLTRHGSDWAAVGETERGVPPIVITLTCTNTGLESTGAVLASQVLSNSPACRVLAGLTKKIANKLGAPIDVMTDRWLPARHVILARAPASEQRGVRAFNPFFCLAEALLQQQQSKQSKEQQPESALDSELSVEALA